VFFPAFVPFSYSIRIHFHLRQVSPGDVSRNYWHGPPPKPPEGVEVRTIGIDLGKTVFHFVGVNARGEVVVRKKGSRTQLLRFTSNLRACLIGMEACGGSHFLGRVLREQGHDVRLMPAQYVKRT
jgi:hypothetical protein